MKADLGDGYAPVAWLPGRDLRTIVPYLWPAPTPLGEPEAMVVRVAPDASVLVRVERPAGAARGTILLLHGLSGSAESHYVVRTARHAVSRGWVAARMNLRTCGGTERLSATLYNAGQGDDVGAVLDALPSRGFPRPYVAAGFSLGGNVVLRYAALAGSRSLADAVAGVCAPLDLERCLRELERPRNVLYQTQFVWSLCAHVRRIRAIRAVAGPPAFARRIRTVRSFDAAFTAPDGGYPSVDAYYARASAGPLLAGTRVPCLVLAAADDPFVPAATFARIDRDGAPVRVAVVDRGGHVGFWNAGAERFWAGEAVVRFFESHAG